MSIVNEQWHEALGEAVNRLAQTYLSTVEKGKALEHPPQFNNSLIVQQVIHPILQVHLNSQD